MGGNGAAQFHADEIYNCRVEGVQALEAATGTPYLQFKLIVTEGEMAGHEIKYEAHASDGRKKRLARELGALGFVPQEGMAWDDLPTIVVGKECAVTMIVDEYNSKPGVVKLKANNLRKKSAVGKVGGVLGEIASLFGGHVTGKPEGLGDKVPF